jgi:hypothetical protein
LSYHASAHTNTCAPAAPPTVRVIEAPQAGFLTVRQAELTTDKIPGCPTLKAPAQVVFYTANVPVLTNDSQIGSDLRVWADEDDRTDFDQQR